MMQDVLVFGRPNYLPVFYYPLIRRYYNPDNYLPLPDRGMIERQNI
jgi:hypothetical protein